MFWNVRGVKSVLGELLFRLDRDSIPFCGVSESHVYGENLSQGDWVWLRGPESLPVLGMSVPSRGLGAFVNGKILPGASVAFSGAHCFCVRIPMPPGKSLYVFTVHWPLACDRHGREKAWFELSASYKKFSKLGIVVIGGDFNSRCALNGDATLDKGGRELFDFCDDEGIFLVNADASKCVGEFSRVSPMTRDGVKTVDYSTIDYVLVDHHFEHLVKGMHLLSKEELDSDHKPVLLELLARLPPPPAPAKARLKLKLKLQGQSHQTLNAFEVTCERYMVNLLADDSACNVEDRQKRIDLGLKKLVDALQSAATEHFGVKLVGPSSRSWWDSEIRFLFHIKLLARRLLDSARGKDPDTVSLARAALNDASALLTRTIRVKQKTLERRSLREIDSAFGSSKLFWARWKARTARFSQGNSVSSVLDPAGNVISDPLEVLKVWRDYAEKLGAESPLFDSSDRAEPPSSFDDSFARRVMLEMRDFLDADGTLPELSRPISWEEVHAAVRQLRLDTAPGPDGLPSEIIRLAGLGFGLALARLFNQIWKDRVWPSSWSVANLVPIYKKMGDILDPSNSRLIALMDILPKVFEKLLDRRLREWSERVGGLSDLQGGFRGGRGTVDQILVLNEIIASRTEDSFPTYTAFIDVAKAYDTVWRPGLWAKLKAAGVDPQTLDLLSVMMRSVCRKVLLNGDCSGQFEVKLGVPQGSVLSPFLYAMYIDGLHTALREKGLGVFIAGRLVPLLLYADDIVLLAGSPEALAASLRVLEQYAAKWRFSVNHGKSNILIFATKRVKLASVNFVWMLDGKEIPRAVQYKYLGIELGGSGRAGKWNALMARMVAKSRSCLNFLVFQGGGANGVRPRTMCHQWSLLCRPLLEYGCELWQGEVSKAWETKIEGVQNRFGRAILGLKANPAAVAVRADLGLASLRTRRVQLKLGYWGKLVNADPDRLLTRVFRSRWAQVVAGRGRLSCLNSFRDCLCEVGLQPHWEACSAPPGWKDTIRDAVADLHHVEMAKAVQTTSSLRLFSSLGQVYSDGTHAHLDDRSNILGSRLLSGLRFGSLWLMKRVASTLNWPPAGGICLLCATGHLEDATHFLLSCPALATHREQFFDVLEKSLTFAGYAGRDLWCLVQRDRFDFPSLLMILACGRVELVCPAGVESNKHADNVGKARWILATTVKNYLTRCWAVRKASVGSIQVCHGSLLHTPAPPSTGRVLAAPVPTNLLSQATRHDWAGWARKPAFPGTKSGRLSNFFVVWRGRTRGVFYKWSDVWSSVAGFPRAVFKGFATLAEAYRAAAPVWPSVGQ